MVNFYTPLKTTFVVPFLPQNTPDNRSKTYANVRYWDVKLMGATGVARSKGKEGLFWGGVGISPVLWRAYPLVPPFRASSCTEVKYDRGSADIAYPALNWRKHLLVFPVLTNVSGRKKEPEMGLIPPHSYSFTIRSPHVWVYRIHPQIHHSFSDEGKSGN